MCPNTTYLLLKHNTRLKDHHISAKILIPPYTCTKLFLPLFQLYSFRSRTCPFGLKGPFSENAPTPIEEQPGPTTKNMNTLTVNF